MLRAQRSMEGLQSGSFKGPYFGNGEKMALCYGYKAIVCLSPPPLPLLSLILLNFAAGVGKSVLWYAPSHLLYVIENSYCKLAPPLSRTLRTRDKPPRL